MVALTSSPAWLQILADVIGRPVSESRVSQASACGAALLALEALGLLETSAAPAFLGEAIAPEPRRHDIYSAARRRQTKLYELVVGA